MKKVAILFSAVIVLLAIVPAANAAAANPGKSMLEKRAACFPPIGTRVGAKTRAPRRL
jgi:hypothetical protein